MFEKKQAPTGQDNTVHDGKDRGIGTDAERRRQWQQR